MDLRQRYAAVMTRLKALCRTPEDWGRVVRVLEKLADDMARRGMTSESDRATGAPTTGAGSRRGSAL